MVHLRFFFNFVQLRKINTSNSARLMTQLPYNEIPCRDRSELYRNLRFSSMRVLLTMKPQLSFVSLLMSAPDDSEIEHPAALATSFTPAIQQPFLDRFKRLPSFEFWCTVFAIGSVCLTYSAFFPTSVKTLPNSNFLSNNRISDITIRTYCIVNEKPHPISHD